ncbi:hypothetical protein Pla123a_04110 [Posidoniimonas polymericola]|uniref:Laminin G domain protein n=1 Tax=Posidoniimonas polymericola TaxID=2528002 RepID=A0A5C5ZE29_9BACT|nr:hypothetical protein [Posidoniimonas polymericola]TWT85604.1 hypothetical protein Pla123a_04110 [Posidoniimonas polymericola]
MPTLCQICLPLVWLASCGVLAAAQPSAQAEAWALIAQDDFADGADDWAPLDADNWRVVSQAGNRVFSQHAKKPSYQPPHRSPFHVALWNAAVVSDCELTARVKSTHADYGGRDVCLIFGYQDPAHYYYAHLGKQTDAIHNQIHIVDGADRRKITATTNDGTPWDDHWHTVRVVRQVESGQIEVYWENHPKPFMTAVDKTFAYGSVGVGTFDDTAEWDDLELRGVVPKPPASHVLPGGPAAVRIR